ncbi:hypothetical protein HMPREF9195_02360 [Treponema medium ATCC 700293]|uniref:Uncharacterized protein n=1 Tax=Treponema medium ATCC 700293 TaxID=1125700 RepID=A0AA87NNS9_TREMD|nr:hypothetical protein [Treponema medium]EPF27608.1 hypothetical protein HMPREF9195_02360 [Treponema medium ATCC 700293]
MLESVSPIIMHQINGAAYCCLASGMEPRAFAHSAVTDYLHDACLRIAPDGTVQEFYLNETITFFNAEKGREEVGIVLPLREAQPLIGLACLDTGDAAAGAFRDSQALLRAEAVLRKLYRLFSCLIAAYKQGTISEAFFRAAMSAPLCLLAEGGTDGGAQDFIVLPPRLVLRCVTAETAAALRFHYPWVHPDAERVPLDDAASFFLATLSYACITGAPPFNSAAVPFAAVDGDAFCANGAVERLVQNIRDGIYVPVEFRCQALRSQFARLINGGLAIAAGQGSAKTAGQHGSVKAAGHKSIGLEKAAGGDIMPNCRAAPLLPLVEQLCSYSCGGFNTPTLCVVTKGIKADCNHLMRTTYPDARVGVVDCDESLSLFAGMQAAEDSAQRAALEAFIQTARKRITRKRFFVRNRVKIAAAAVVCAALIAVTAAIVQYIRKPPETAGMSAEAVIRGFYTAVGTLDQTITGAYTKNKAAALYDGLMVHLYVTGKTREAYERKKIYYTPQEFFNLCESAWSVDVVPAADAATGMNAAGSQAASAPQEQERERNMEARLIRYKKAVIKSLNGGSVYGISGLEIVPAAQAGWFDVTFYHWMPIFSSEEAEAAAKAMEKALEASGSASNAELSERSAFPIQVLYKHDRVQVISIKGSFFIGAIESAESTVAADSSNALLEDCALPPADRPAYLKGL